MSEASVSIDADAPHPRWEWLTRVGAAASFVVPFTVVIGHAGTGASWRNDRVLLQSLGMLDLGQSGAMSALLARASFFVPLGSVHFRVALAAAVVVGAAGLAIRAMTRDLLARHADAPLLGEALATIAALTATLSATAQHDVAVLGGGVALLLATTLLAARPCEALAAPGRAVIAGMLAGALCAENMLTAMPVLAGVAIASFLAGARLAMSRDSVARAGPVAIERGTRARAPAYASELRVAPAAALWGLGTAVTTAALLLSPPLVRTFAPSSFLELGRAMNALALGDVAARPVGGVMARFAGDGAILVVLGGVGLTLALVQRRLRAEALPLAVATVWYALSTFGEGRLFTVEEVAPLHGLASAALAAGAALALQAISMALLAWRLPMAKGAAILLVMTDLTLAVANAEEASFANDASGWRGAEAFTDEALERLPPRAALLLRTRSAARRILTARLAQGTRPDVLVVPMPATGDPRLALRLLRAEPALQKAVQDISLEGRPGEEAMTILADARPLLVELDPTWDRRVFSHLVPEHLWLRFFPEPRGSSDRKAAFAELRQTSERILAASRLGDKPDRGTVAMLQRRLIDGAIMAAQLGDREEATALASRIGALPGGELFAAELMQKLLLSKSGPVDVKGLMR
jgi:hypothetical protein